jgi:hypothetical protein
MEKIAVDLRPVNTFRYNQISNYKFQFVLLGDENQALHTPVECKDYFQDIFFTESTGISTDVYGIHWEQGRVTPGEYYRIALLGGEVSNLEQLLPNIQMFVNDFENALGFPCSHFYPTENPGVVVVEFPKEWTVNGPMISAFTSLLRLGWLYTGEESVLKYLKKIAIYKDDLKRPQNFPRFMKVEIKRLDNTIRKLASLLKGKKYEKKWDDIEIPSDIDPDYLEEFMIEYIHDFGLVDCKDFPQEEV